MLADASPIDTESSASRCIEPGSEGTVVSIHSMGEALTARVDAATVQMLRDEHAAIVVEPALDARSVAGLDGAEAARARGEESRHVAGPMPAEVAEKRAESVADAPRQHKSESRGTIVLADDDAVTLTVVGNMLEKAHYRVIAVENGLLACEAVRRERPDLVLLDWSMPVMNGLEALKTLQADKATRDIPIVMLTSHAFMEQIVMHWGSVDFLVKPCRAHDLVARIEQQRHLRRQAMLAALGEGSFVPPLPYPNKTFPVLQLKAAVSQKYRSVVSLMKRSKT